MLRFFLKRVLFGIPVLIAVATLTFIIMHWVPGGPFDSEKILPPEIIANIESKYHLDEPVQIQYLLYMKQLLQGDLGPSYKYIGRDVSDILRDTFPVSFALGMCSVLVVLGLGLSNLTVGIFNNLTVFTPTLGVSSFASNKDCNSLIVFCLG